MKTVLKGNFIAVNVYIKKEGTQVNNLTLYLKELEKNKNKLNSKLVKESNNKD